MSNIDIVYKNEVIVLDDKEDYLRAIKRNIMTEFKNSEYPELYYPQFTHCFNLDELKKTLTSNHKSRCLIFDRNLDENNIHQFEGDKSIEIMNKFCPGALIYSISAYNGTDLPNEIKFYSKQPQKLKLLAKDYLSELEHNLVKEELIIGKRLVLVEYLTAKIDKIENDNIVLECYGNDQVYYLDFSPKQFKKIQPTNIKIGTSVELRILEDELGNRINDIIHSENSFGFIDFLKKDSFFNSIPDYDADDIMNDLIFEDE